MLRFRLFFLPALLSLVLSLGLSLTSQAQLALPGSSPVTVTFDSFGSSATAALPSGFVLAGGTSPTYSNAGNTAATTQAAGTTGTGALSSNSAGGAYNFGNGVNSTAPDRALGFLSSSSYSSPRNILLAVQNTSGATITELTVAYDVEKYRLGTRAFEWQFFTSPDGSIWTQVTTLTQSYPADGATGAPVNPPTTSSKTTTLTGLNLASGATTYLRWAYVGAGGSTNGQGLGLDNLVLTPTLGNPGTPTITTGTVTGSPFCVTATSGSSVSVPFTVSGTLSGDFAVQLSSASGTFPADATTSLIGQGTSSPLAATLPAGTPAGSGYRVRVVHAASGTLGSPNPSNLVVNAAPATNPVTVTPSTAQAVLTTGTGATLTASASVASSYQWAFGTAENGPYTSSISGATSASYQLRGADFGGAGTYYLVARATSTCGSVPGTSAPITVTVTAPTPELTITPLTVPDFGSIYVGAASGSQPVTVRGTNLSSPVTFTPPPGFEIRTGSAPFACCAITLTPQNGTLPSTTIDVRFVPTLAQVYLATVAVGSTDVPSQDPVNVSGTGVAPIFPATVQTAPVTGITATQALSGGTISSDGNAEVTERGVVYATTAAPTLANQVTVDGTGAGTFTSTLTGLQPNTLYYVRAYATNEVGTSYGEQLTFTTARVALAAEPTQSSTLTASQLTPTTVQLSASGGTGSKRLFLATQSADLLSVPADGTTYSGNATLGQGDQPAPGIFVVQAGVGTSVTITGLQPNTEYTFAVFDYNDDNTTGAENYRTQDPGKLTLSTPEQPAQLLLEENFLYASGEALTTRGWTGHNATGTTPILTSNGGLARSDYNATGGNAAALTASGEDIHRTFAPVAPGTPVYAAFLVQVGSSTGADYFFHLGPDPISTTYRARVLVKPGTTAGKVQFGVSGSGTTAVYDPTEYETGTPYLLVVRYSFGSSGTETRLYVNPGVSEPTASNATSTEAATSSPTNIGSVALRQGSNTSPLLLDGLRVGTTFAVVRQQLPAPLPVQLSAFTGQVQQASAVLRWSTAQELHNDRFELERARDGAHFTRIATLKGKGTTSTASSYSYTDAGVLQPGQTLYYRLRQVDTDGSASYSKVVVLSGTGLSLQAVPNPAHDQVRLLGASAATAQVLDLTGRVLRTVATTESVSLRGLAPGVYVVRCGSQTTKLQVE
ncbi:T9SS type A sorting domain-containing protein [Hymenobacter metallicola]|uniref:T9SS type A sorting domain-containing protein n=1 Tax=Hymenobacter metallicola TaxID=2563114 RepID=A0A4Z0PT57_9BACT|nr:T9SS type A sorting domain-containing protein [Hymenobacter metallicola]TGE20910.1 T9SS type A sorting domain-containing protein [Hymenobacter metallicola]